MFLAQFPTHKSKKTLLSSHEGPYKARLLNSEVLNLCTTPKINCLPEKKYRIDLCKLINYIKLSSEDERTYDNKEMCA